MITRDDASKRKERPLEPHPSEDGATERSALEKLKGRLLSKLKKADPNVYPLY